MKIDEPGTSASHRHAPRRWALVVALAASVLGSGCYNTVLVARDERSMAAARATWRLNEASGVEVQGFRTRATETQSFNDLDDIQVDGRRIPGPVVLDHRVRHAHAHAAYNHRIPLRRGFELEWMAGVAASRAEWDSVSRRAGDPTLSSRVSWSGPMGGALGRYRVTDDWSIELRTTGAVALGGSGRSGTYAWSEAVVAWRPGVLALRAGVARLQSTTVPTSGDTEQQLRVRGPYLNLGLEF